MVESEVIEDFGVILIPPQGEGEDNATIAYNSWGNLKKFENAFPFLKLKEAEVGKSYKEVYIVWRDFQERQWALERKGSLFILGSEDKHASWEEIKKWLEEQD